MKKIIFAMGALLPICAMGQQYGVTNYKVNGQAVASQYNYSVLGPTTLAAGAGTITINPNFCSVIIGTGRTFNPWSTSASIKIVDTANSTNTETVTPSSILINASQCNISATFANAHSAGAYFVRSGTCGLKEAFNDLGASGTALVTQEFYDQGCLASTITSLAGGATGNFVIDISNGKYDVYGWNTVTSALAKISSFGNMSFSPILVLAGRLHRYGNRRFDVGPLLLGRTRRYYLLKHDGKYRAGDESRRRPGEFAGYSGNRRREWLFGSIHSTQEWFRDNVDLHHGNSHFLFGCYPHDRICGRRCDQHSIYDPGGGDSSGRESVGCGAVKGKTTYRMASRFESLVIRGEASPQCFAFTKST